MKRLNLVIAIMLFALASSFLLSAAEQQPAEKARKDNGVPVVVGKVTSQPLGQALKLVGKLNAVQSVDIASDVSGKIEHVAVKANQQVEKGQSLLSLDGSPQKAALDEMRATLKEAQRKLGEFERLSSRGAITKTEIDAQRAQVGIAQAKYDAALAVWQRYQVTAPFSGTVGLFDLSAGQWVSSGQSLLTLDDLSAMNLDLYIPERYLAEVAVGMPVTATAAAWGEAVFQGQLTHIDTRIDADTLSVKVRALFANPERKLKPGMLLSANLEFADINKPIIPVQAVQYAGTKRFVFLVDKNHVKQVEVSLGERRDNSVFVDHGLALGDEIVVQGMINMQDGLKIQRVDTQGKVIQSADNAFATNKGK